MYANYGWSLMGLIVETVSKMSFEQFIRKRIFVELNMTRSIVSPRDNEVDRDYFNRVAPSRTRGATPSEAGPDYADCKYKYKKYSFFFF